MKIDLNAQEFTEEFRAATIYAKSAIVKAVQVTKDGLNSGAYAEKGVYFDEEKKTFMIDTYVMREVPVEGTGGCIRAARFEDTHPLMPGDWIITNPKVYESDCDNNYPTDDKTFKEKYEETKNHGFYCAKGMARIIKNHTGKEVEIEAPWGGPQYGDAKCYFCAPYKKDEPNDLAEGERYILSENDFHTYLPADEVLGEGWNSK